MAQRTVERRLVELARTAVARTRVPHLALAGGVASNVKAMRQGRLRDDIDDVSVFPSMGDGGLAAGAALCAAMEGGDGFAAVPDDLGLGPAFDDAEMRSALPDDGL